MKQLIDWIKSLFKKHVIDDLPHCPCTFALYQINEGAECVQCEVCDAWLIKKRK